MDREGDAQVVRVLRLALNMIVLAAGWISTRVAMQAVLRATELLFVPVRMSLPCPTSPSLASRPLASLSARLAADVKFCGLGKKWASAKQNR
jgi:hypothetical protein